MENLEHPSGHERILAEVSLKKESTPHKWYSIWLDAVERNMEVKMFNTFFFGVRRSNWNHQGLKLYVPKTRFEFEMDAKFLDVDSTDITPLPSLRAFFEVIGYNHKKRKYET